MNFCGTILLMVALPFVGSAAIDISTGRQLFVDDFLVEATTNVVRHWNRPVKMDGPIVWPGSGAAPQKTDGSSGASEGEAVNLTCATDGGLASSGATLSTRSTRSTRLKLTSDTPHTTRVLQGFPRFQPSERHRDRVAAPRSGCFRAGAEIGAVNPPR